MGAWNSVMGVLDDVYRSAFGKSSIKTTMAFDNVAVARTVANSKAVSAFNGFGRTATADIVLNKGNKDVAERVIKKGQTVRVNNISELNEVLGMNNKMSAVAKDKQADYAKAIAGIQKHTGANAVLDGADFQAFIGREGKDGLGLVGTARGYFGDAELGSQRMKIAAGTVAGTGIAMRYLQGGNLTTTAQGERNIAGVPFI